MNNRHWPVCGMIMAASTILSAQQSKLSGPVGGYVFDSAAHVVRPIQGVPGAALLGDPVNFGFDLAAAFVSPAQDSAFVVGKDASLHLFRWNAGAASEIGLGGISGVPQMVVYSPSGTAAALFSAGKARIINGLPGAPVLMGTISVPNSGQNMETRGSAVRRPLATLALTDDGAYLLSISGGSARLLSLHGENRSLVTAQSDALVAFAPGGHDAAVMDSVSGLTLIRDASGVASPQSLAAIDDSLGNPAGLAFSQDRQTLYLASGKSRSVAAFNLAAGSRTSIGCACSPATLAPMGNFFRLNELSPEPLWLLDLGSAGPRTVFVPARAE